MGVTSRAVRVLSLMLSLLLLAAEMPSPALCNLAKARNAAAMSTCDKPCCPQQHGQDPVNRHGQQTQACDAHCAVPFIASAEVTVLRDVAAEPMLRVAHLRADDSVVSARTQELSLDTEPPRQAALSIPLRI